MRHVIEDLNTTRNELLRVAEAHSMFVFPAGLAARGTLVTATWPEANVAEFAAFGAAAGARVLYVEELFAGAGDIAEWAGRLEGGNGELLDGLRTHEGEMTDLVAWWCVDGVVHDWWALAAWWDDWYEAADVAAESLDEVRITAAAGAARERVREWATELAASVEFRRAPRPSHHSLCRRLLGVPDELVDDVVSRAVELADAELAPEARRMRSEGHTKAAIQAKLGITGPALDRYLALG